MADPEQTREALVEALRAHVAACVEGAYLTDFVIISSAALAADPDATTYVTESSDGPPHHRLGLVRYLLHRSEDMIFGDGD